MKLSKLLEDLKKVLDESGDLEISKEVELFLLLNLAKDKISKDLKDNKKVNLDA